MNKRLMSIMPHINKRILYALGSVMTLVGVVLLIAQKDHRIGNTVLLLGVLILGVTVFFDIRKVEIVGNCGFSRAFLKKRFFYLSEIREINISPEHDRMVVCGVDGTKIFDISKTNGCFDEIENAIKNRNNGIVKEKETESSRKYLWLESISRIVLCLTLVISVVGIFADEYSGTLLGALAVIGLIRVLIMSHINDAEDTTLLDEGKLIEDAILINYINNEWGSAYPIFEFTDVNGRHVMYAKTKMKMKLIEECMGKICPIYYAPGKAMSVRLKTEEDE